MSNHHQHLDRVRWARTRKKVFLRDGHRCVICAKAGRLECDHIVPLAVDPDQDPYDPDGCQTLCRSCHFRKTASENRRDLVPGQQAWRALIEEIAQ